jgi:predicted DNA-binding WGR domain protein
MLREKRLKVCVWLAERMPARDYQSYLVDEDHDTDGPTNGFAEDLGTFSVDPDYLDGKYTGRKKLTVEVLLKPLAYSFSFSEAVAKAAAEKGICAANTAVALYSHEFRGRWPKDSPLTFIGSFDYIPASKHLRPKVTAAGRNDFCYLEYEDWDEGIRKCWCIQLRGLTHVIKFGLIGFRGKEQVREFADKKTAREQFKKAIQAKEKAGYKVRRGAAK